MLSIAASDLAGTRRRNCTLARLPVQVRRQKFDEHLVSQLDVTGSIFLQERNAPAFGDLAKLRTTGLRLDVWSQ